MLQPHKNTSTTLSGGYRYSFNGMETDHEVSGHGNSYTTQFRQYDPRLGRWKSLDPLAGKYPGMSPFTAFNDNPVYFVDPLGLESAKNSEKKRERQKGNKTGDNTTIDEIPDEVVLNTETARIWNDGYGYTVTTNTLTREKKSTGFVNHSSSKLTIPTIGAPYSPKIQQLVTPTANYLPRVKSTMDQTVNPPIITMNNIAGERTIADGLDYIVQESGAASERYYKLWWKPTGKNNEYGDPLGFYVYEPGQVITGSTVASNINSFVGQPLEDTALLVDTEIIRQVTIIIASSDVIQNNIRSAIDILNSGTTTLEITITASPGNIANPYFAGYIESQIFNNHPNLQRVNVKINYVADPNLVGTGITQVQITGFSTAVF